VVDSQPGASTPIAAISASIGLKVVIPKNSANSLASTSAISASNAASSAS